jgi:hypothetical protein
MANYTDISTWLTDLNNNESSEGTRQYMLAHGIADAGSSGKTFTLNASYNSSSNFPKSYHHEEPGSDIIAYFVDTSGERHLVIIPESDLPDNGAGTSIYGTWKRVTSGSEESFSIEKTFDYVNVKSGQAIPTVTSAEVIDSNITVSDVDNTDWVFIEDAKYKNKDYYTLKQQSGTTYQWKKKEWDPSDLKSSLLLNLDASSSSNIIKNGNDVSNWTDASSTAALSFKRVGTTAFPQYDSNFGSGKGGITFGANKGFSSDFTSNSRSTLFGEIGSGTNTDAIEDVNIFIALTLSSINSTSSILTQAESAATYTADQNGFKLTAGDQRFTSNPVVFEHGEGKTGVSLLTSSAPSEASAMKLIHICSSSSLGKTFIKINGHYSSETPEAFSLTSGEELIIGGSDDSLSGKLEGTIGQIIIIKKSIGNKEIEKVEGYLARKWGIAISSSHPYSMSAPLSIEDSEVLSEVSSELWTPKEIGEDLKLWLDFSDKSTFIREHTDYYQNISKIIDKTSSAHVFTAHSSFSSKSPSQRYVDSTENGLTMVNFTADEYYSSESGAILGSATDQYAFHIVSKVEYVDNKNDAIFSIQDVGGQKKSLNLRAGVDTPTDPGDFYFEPHFQYQLGSNTYTKTRTTDHANSQLSIFSFLMKGVGTKSETRINGSKVVEEASSQNQSFSSDYKINVNTNHNLSKGADTLIGEIVALNSSNLSLNQKVEGYLAHKWGNQHKLNSDHPYKVSAPYVEADLRKVNDVVDGYIFIGGSDMGGRGLNSELDSYFNAKIDKTIFENRYHSTVNDPTSSLERGSGPNAVIKGSTAKNSTLHGIELEFFRQYFGTKAQPAVLKYFIDDATIADFDHSATGSINGWTSLITAIDDFYTSVTGNGKSINWKGIVWFPDANELTNTSYTSELSTFIAQLESELISNYGATNKLHYYLIEPQKHNGSGVDDSDLAAFSTRLSAVASANDDVFLIDTSSYKTDMDGGQYFNKIGLGLIAGRLVNDYILAWRPEFSSKVVARYDFSNPTSSSNSINSVDNVVNTGRNLTLTHNAGTKATDNVASINSIPVASFESNTKLVTTDAPLGAMLDTEDEFSYFIVFKPDGNNSSYSDITDRFIFKAGNSVEIEYKSTDYHDEGATINRRKLHFNGAEALNLNCNPLDEVYLAEFSRKKGDNLSFQSLLTVRLNGKEVYQKYLDDGTIGAEQLTVGGIKMDVAEIVIANEVLTTAERQAIEGYLARKWGKIADLPANHPYVSEDPVRSLT